MKTKELDEGVSEDSDGQEIVSIRAKKALVGAGARFLFYPTLVYNVLRNKMQAEFRWWDQIDQFILLGAVPFPKDVPRLQQLGVRGVITLNEPYETLVSSNIYKVHGIDHLVIPTRDYYFAPSCVDICRAVDFIHRNASQGRTTYVHCKAGRARSATIVICYLIEYKNMTPMGALEYVRSRRPRVLLAPSQWQAVQEYSKHKLEFPALQSPKPAYSLTEDEVLITEDDLEGYSVEDDRDQMFSSCQTGTIIVRRTPTSPLEEDEVLITEADLEGYETFVDDYEDTSITLSQNKQTNPMMRKLSCVFASVKLSVGNLPVSSRFPPIRAR
ncbi:dual specificity protein phosphatase DSP8 [Canna indica]|uniref:phosphatidylglycerophosphatase n=1 Tax=Canna indica TaxID=4628 RepID=A0AAQ3KUB5_9LILI|nr:dual specificity protein phosphatase DSP8 [Canna indica]